VLNMHHLAINDQLIHLESFFESWKADREQVDDLCIIGMRL
jgi:hypothetical protein